MSRDFRPLVFSSNNFPKAPDTRVKSLFAYGLEFAKIFDFEIADFRLSGVNDTAQAKKTNTKILCVIDTAQATSAVSLTSLRQ
jgi:hypothetical protein